MDWIRHVLPQPGHFVGTPTAQSMLKSGMTISANLVRQPEECNAIRVRRANRRIRKRKGPSFMVAIIPNKQSWTVWRCWRIALAWQRFIASKGSKKRPCVSGCNEPLNMFLNQHQVKDQGTFFMSLVQGDRSLREQILHAHPCTRMPQCHMPLHFHPAVSCRVGRCRR